MGEIRWPVPIRRLLQGPVDRHGDKNTGDPVEYDNLKLVLSDDTVEIAIFNSGITSFTSDDERVRRIHRFLCKLEESKIN